MFGLKRAAATTKTSLKRTFLNNATDAKSAIAYATANKAEFMDLFFIDFLGTRQHIGLSISELDEGSFENGFGFDGSSIRCWQDIHNSDMVIMPVAETACMDPFIKRPTVAFQCNIVDGTTGNSRYTRDPRYILEKCINNLKTSNICDHARIGPEAEFFVFDDVRYGESMGHSMYQVDSGEAFWNSGRQEPGGNLAYKNRAKEGYFPSPPFDTLVDLRNDMVAVMESIGMHVEAAHHEVAAAGQCEIDFRFGGMMETADALGWYKYIVRNVAKQHGKSATFMPKPLLGDNGSGMHQHYSLHDASGKNLFTGDGPAGLSEMALYFIGGIIKHADSILAFTNPGTNSYKRLVPGFEAPIFAAYSGRNRSAFCRIPVSHPKGRRVEFRTPDPTCNPYLAFSAVVQAGVDGIKNKIHPGDPCDINLYEASASELANLGIKGVPSTLKESLNALEKDHAYLLDGGVFTEDVLEKYIEHKNEEWTGYLQRPTPYEYTHYYDC